MVPAKLAKLTAAGWTVGRIQDLLKLSPEEAAYVEVKAGLAVALRAQRQKRGLSQVEAAQALRSSQSRVAKMEAAHPTVTIDLLLRGLLALGATPRQISKAIAGVAPKAETRP